jgi:hypothetical protein
VGGIVREGVASSKSGRDRGARRERFGAWGFSARRVTRRTQRISTANAATKSLVSSRVSNQRLRPSVQATESSRDRSRSRDESHTSGCAFERARATSTFVAPPENEETFPVAGKVSSAWLRRPEVRSHEPSRCLREPFGPIRPPFKAMTSHAAPGSRVCELKRPCVQPWRVSDREGITSWSSSSPSSSWRPSWSSSSQQLS